MYLGKIYAPTLRNPRTHGVTGGFVGAAKESPRAVRDGSLSMAGRPRTMLKRIADWKNRTDELVKEIEARIPKPHDDDFDFEAFRLLDVCDKHRDPVMTELVMLNDVPERERVGCGWVMVEDIAGRLSWYLAGLEEALRQRYERKNVRNLPQPATDNGEYIEPDVEEPGEN